MTKTLYNLRQNGLQPVITEGGYFSLRTRSVFELLNFHYFQTRDAFTYLVVSECHKLET